MQAATRRGIHAALIQLSLQNSRRSGSILRRLPPSRQVTWEGSRCDYGVGVRWISSSARSRSGEEVGGRGVNVEDSVPTTKTSRKEGEDGKVDSSDAPGPNIIPQPTPARAAKSPETTTTPAEITKEEGSPKKDGIPIPLEEKPTQQPAQQRESKPRGRPAGTKGRRTKQKEKDTIPRPEVPRWFLDEGVLLVEQNMVKRGELDCYNDAVRRAPVVHVGGGGEEAVAVEIPPKGPDSGEPGYGAGEVEAVVPENDAVVPGEDAVVPEKDAEVNAEKEVVEATPVAAPAAVEVASENKGEVTEGKVEGGLDTAPPPPEDLVPDPRAGEAEELPELPMQVVMNINKDVFLDNILTESFDRMGEMSTIIQVCVDGSVLPSPPTSTPIATTNATVEEPELEAQTPSLTLSTTEVTLPENESTSQETITDTTTTIIDAITTTTTTTTPETNPPKPLTMTPTPSQTPDNRPSPNHVIRGKYMIHVHVWREIMAYLHAGLSLPKSSYNDSAVAMKSHLLLRCPHEGGIFFLDSIVEHAAALVRADLVRLDVQDLEEMAGDFLGDAKYCTSSPPLLISSDLPGG